MSRMSRVVLGLALGLSLSAPSAGQAISIPTESESGVQVQVDALLASPWGSRPLHVTIRNDSGRDRSWTFDSRSSSPAGFTRRYRSRLAVGAGEQRTFELVVPLGGDVGEISSLQVRVLGFGVTSSDWQYPSGVYTTETLPIPALSQSLHMEAQPGLVFDPGLLPSDWRGLLGLRLLVLTEDEWKSASPGARSALSEWICRGGRLVRVGGESLSSEALGLGTMVTAEHPESQSEWGEVLTTGDPSPTISYRAWAQERFSAIETRSGLLLAFLVVYAPLAGPVNLYLLCSKGRRARLFWTLPALALGASLLLTAIILVQDGVGGRGHRVTYVRLVPELTREVLVQEQVSRTGALLKRGFALDEAVAIYEAPLGFSGNEELASDGSKFRGGWFRSRSIQAQRIDAVRPGRAQVSFVEGKAITSSIEERLEEIYYRDEDGRPWRATGLDPGAKATLLSATEEEYERFWGGLSREAGPAARVHLYQSYWERGVFLARAGASDRPIETLEGIDWRDTVIYAGPISGEGKP